MDNLICKKVVLWLIDCSPKSANEIANEIDVLLTTVEGQLTALVSEDICEKINQGKVSQYVLRTDIAAFERLVKEFLSEKEEHDEETKQFITSEYYFARIDCELVDYVLKRFYLDSVHQADDEKESIRRVLLASPSALSFAFHGDTASFNESWAHLHQLKSSDENRDRVTQMLSSDFGRQLSDRLIVDTTTYAHSPLYDKLQIRLVKISTQVSLATIHEKYVETIGNHIFGSRKMEDDSAQNWRTGQLISYVNPIDLSDDGLALLNLGEFQSALNNFDDALDAVQDPTQKAIVLNNKGLTFLSLKQYQKSLECFEKGIAFDSEGKFSELRDNKQVAEEYLARATDADNLTELTQIRFIQRQPVPFRETRFYEFKEIKVGNATRSIADTSDIYTAAFLNREGGRIFWGVRDSDRITVGVKLDEQARNEIRVKVSEKLGAIRPPISVKDWQLEFHNVYDLQGEILVDLWVVELLVSPPQRRDVFYTGRGELHVKTEGGKKKLLGPEVTEFIRSRFQKDIETP